MPLPKVIKSLGSSAYRLIPLPYHYGKRYREIAAFLDEASHWGPERLRDYQFARLRRIVAHSYTNVPFYRELYGAVGFEPGDLRTWEDFTRLPTFDRAIILERGDDFKAKNFERYNTRLTYTSGTSGNPLRVFRSMDTELFRRASVWRWRQSQGIDYYAPLAELAGNVTIADPEQLFYWNARENIWHLNKKLRDRGHIRSIFAHLRSKKVQLVTGAPSTILLIAQLALEEGLPPFDCNSVMTTGELVRPMHKEKIASIFGDKHRDMYGNRENSAKAYQFEYDGDYFVHGESCYIELLDVNGDTTNEKSGEICSTSLINEAFPLIRYRSADNAADCGIQEYDGLRRWAIKPLGGRERDMILTPNGLMSINLIHNLGEFDMSLIRNFTIHQHKLDELEVRLCPAPGYDKARNEALFLIEIRKQFPDVMKIKLSYIDEMPITNNDKVKFIQSELTVDYLAGKVSLEEAKRRAIS